MRTVARAPARGGASVHNLIPQGPVRFKFRVMSVRTCTDRSDRGAHEEIRAEPSRAELDPEHRQRRAEPQNTKVASHEVSTILSWSWAGSVRVPVCHWCRRLTYCGSKPGIEGPEQCVLPVDGCCRARSNQREGGRGQNGGRSGPDSGLKTILEVTED